MLSCAQVQNSNPLSYINPKPAFASNSKDSLEINIKSPINSIPPPIKTILNLDNPPQLNSNLRSDIPPPTNTTSILENPSKINPL